MSQKTAYPIIIRYHLSMISEDIVSMAMPTAFGVFDLCVWNGDRGRELVALSTPGLDPSKEVMVRVHSECLTGDLFHSLTCDCGPQKDLALKKIQEHGNGIFIYHRQEGRNAGLFKKIQGYNLMQSGMDTHEAYIKLAGHPDPREYSDVLTALTAIMGRRKAPIRLLTNNPYKALFLERHGYRVVTEPLHAGASVHNASYTQSKTDKFLHNSIGYAPYASVTLSLSDIRDHRKEIGYAIQDIGVSVEGRKLFLGVDLSESVDLKSAEIVEDLKIFHTSAISRSDGVNLVLHMYYPESRSVQRDLKRFLHQLSFPYSIQFRLPLDVSIGFRVDVDLLDSFHAEHMIFQLKESHSYLLEQKGFAEYFSSPNKFLLLEDSWGSGQVADPDVTRQHVLRAVSRGLSRVAVAGGYSVENASRVHDLEDYFKLPISVDAESRLRTDGKLDIAKMKRYLAFFFPARVNI